MLSLHENEMSDFLEVVKEYGKTKCDHVYNHANHPTIRSDAMEEVDDEYFNGLYFKEITGDPLTCLRRWDVMRYFLSYDEIDDKLKHGPMKLMDKIIKRLNRYAAYGKVVIVVAIPRDRYNLTEDDVENYLRPDGASKEVIKYFNRLNKEGNLTYLPVTNDQLINQRVLYNRMLNMGVSRNVEGEYEPGEFVIITPNLSYFVNPEGGVCNRQLRMQSLLSKGIRIVELNDREYIRCGQNVVNRSTTNAYLYFPTQDIYLKASGVEYVDAYINSDYTEARYNIYNGRDKAMIFLVPTENNIFPFHTFYQVIMSLLERTVFDSHYDRYKDINAYVCTMNRGKYDDLERGISDIDVFPCSNLDAIDFQMVDSSRVTIQDIYEFDNILKNMIDKNTIDGSDYNFLFFHIPNWITFDIVLHKELARVCDSHDVTLVLLQEDSRETNIYKERMKRKNSRKIKAQ